MKMFKWALITVVLSTLVIWLVLMVLPIDQTEHSDKEITARVKITVINKTDNVLSNLYISSNSHPNVKAYSDIKISGMEYMDIELPCPIEGSASLTYIDNSGVKHDAIIIGYLMPYNEANVTVINADENGLVVDVEEK